MLRRCWSIVSLQRNNCRVSGVTFGVRKIVIPTTVSGFVIVFFLSIVLGLIKKLKAVTIEGTRQFHAFLSVLKKHDRMQNCFILRSVCHTQIMR